MLIPEYNLSLKPRALGFTVVIVLVIITCQLQRDKPLISHIELSMNYTNVKPVTLNRPNVSLHHLSNDIGLDVLTELPERSMNPSGLCVADCVRIRRRLKAWPIGKPKGVIYILAHRLQLLNTALYTLHENFNRKYNYPVVLFHEPNFRRHRSNVKQAWNDSVYFQEVSFTVPAFLTKPVPKKIRCRSRIAYRHMCRFHAIRVYQEPILQGFDFLFRLDDDSNITAPMTNDIFEFMSKENITYGYNRISQEKPKCVVGLREVTEWYISKRQLQPTFFYSWPSMDIFYNNFEISQASLWRSTEYQDYANYLDRLGGIFYHRWGDAAIKTLAVTMFIPAHRTHCFVDIGYEHYVNHSQTMNSVYEQ